MNAADIVIGAKDFARLQAQLFQSDGDEHAAVGLAGISRTPRGTRILIRELIPIPPASFPPGDHGYRMIAPLAVAQLADRAAENGLSYVAFHSHPAAQDTVALSSDDLRGHERLYPHLQQITDGKPVVGAVLGRDSAAGEIWLADSGKLPLASVRVVGHHLKRLTPTPTAARGADGRFDRQARLFGDRGQALLRALRVVVVGAGGGGSMLVEQLAHLGVGELTVVDFDIVERHNLSRIVGAEPRDARRTTKKVRVLERLVQRVDPTINFYGVDGDIADPEAARHLVDCDFIFLATDTNTSRLVANAAAHRFLIPLIQIGAKVEFSQTGRLEQAYVAVRPVLPGTGCLYCNGLIDPTALQREALSPENRRAQDYLGIGDVIDPSVVTLNGISAAHAATTMMLMATGLAEPEVLAHRLYLPTTSETLTITTTHKPECPFCVKAYGLGGDTRDLPVRLRPEPQPTSHARRLLTNAHTQIHHALAHRR